MAHLGLANYFSSFLQCPGKMGSFPGTTKGKREKNREKEASSWSNVGFGVLGGGVMKIQC